MRKWYCPVCGYDMTPSAHESGATENDVFMTTQVLYTEICPSCGIEFGQNDMLPVNEMIAFYRRWRQEWIQNGMKWWSIDNPPLDWNPRKQLKNIPKEFLGPDEHY